jgi:hypothetical protein
MVATKSRGLEAIYNNTSGTSQIVLHSLKKKVKDLCDVDRKILSGYSN